MAIQVSSSSASSSLSSSLSSSSSSVSPLFCLPSALIICRILPLVGYILYFEPEQLNVCHEEICKTWTAYLKQAKMPFVFLNRPSARSRPAYSEDIEHDTKMTKRFLNTILTERRVCAGMTHFTTDLHMTNTNSIMAYLLMHNARIFQDIVHLGWDLKAQKGDKDIYSAEEFFGLYSCLVSSPKLTSVTLLDIDLYAVEWGVKVIMNHCLSVAQQPDRRDAPAINGQRPVQCTLCKEWKYTIIKECTTPLDCCWQQDPATVRCLDCLGYQTCWGNSPHVVHRRCPIPRCDTQGCTTPIECHVCDLNAHAHLEDTYCCKTHHVEEYIDDDDEEEGEGDAEED